MAFVYHIHLPEHLGFLDKGYIGFTSNTVESRWKDHKALAASLDNTYPIHNAIRKYGNELILTTLVEGSSEYCLDVENRLRPIPNMGWNIACGGGAPMLGKNHTAGTFKNSFPVERRLQISEFHKTLPIWLHGSANKTVWASADKIYNCFKAHDSIGVNLLGQAFNLGVQELDSMRKEFLKGWNPYEDQDWNMWKSEQTEFLSGGWEIGNSLIKKKKPELTDSLRASRAIAGKTRVWTEEAKANLRDKNLGRKHTPETLKKMSEVLTGLCRTDEQKAAIKKRLKEQPWTNATAIHKNWAQAGYIKNFLGDGNKVSDLLKDFGLPRKSGALQKIITKIKAGWNPCEDTAYMLWLTEYKNKECYGT